MNRDDESPVFDREWANAVWEYVHGADERNAALNRVHKEGWKSVADAIKIGLGSIADAIRSNR